MRRIARCLILAAPLIATAASAQRAPSPAPAPAPAAPAPAARTPVPHEWLFGSWTGGLFPAGETEGARCFAQPTVIFTREVVMRTGILDPAYRQRLIETVATGAGATSFRFVPAGPSGSRVPPEIGFGCPGGPDSLEVEQVGPDEIAFPNCREMPSPLRRCGSPNR
ncbi:hypothetical protein GXW78_12160 [Roseomonas terrae]|jgi:hypothetical protein|uniref:Uncharacterized protein n=1 Tax=Neoroseomonas terrae TaxID=424799 RepID=A0ABS5EHI4_9PROT|nr:hypothetical protein [Neoroseomonas terrae]MBR0650420.1 hypothetical protein [Neoroseomonas terrae]